MPELKTMLLVLAVSTLFPRTDAAPYWLYMVGGMPSHSVPALLAVHRDHIITLLPSSQENLYYVVNTEALGDEINEKSAVLSSGELMKSNSTELINANKTIITDSPRLLTLGDFIEIIPFLPIEINVPDMFSSVAGFVSWMFNRRPQDQSRPRIYVLLKRYGGNNYPSKVGLRDTVVPYYGGLSSYGVLTRRLLVPIMNTKP
ncbi:uncharacterized protein [Periplaneta americana]|uniref:uncharacterized protein n=1 Tax=Periplaneta americana TaxID=6978 RepID=UPI0037E926D8